jgi:hypothetical protein
MLIPLPNDRVECLGTKTERFVRCSPSILDRTSASVVSSDVEDRTKQVISDLVGLLKSYLL